MRKIKKISTYTALVGKDEETRHEYRNSFQEFDGNQNIIKEVKFHSNGEVESASGFKFDKSDRLIEEIHYFEDDQVGEIISYKLNADGKMIEIETTYADASKSVKKMSRFENMISVKSYDEDGELEGEDLIKYDGDGNILEEIKFDEERVMNQRTVNEYNGDRQLIGKTKYGENEEFLVRAVYDYDENGNSVRETQLNEKGKLINQIGYEYDENGEQIAWQNNNYLHKTNYDKKGRVLNEETKNRVNNMVENFTEYRYNEYDKVVEERTFSMGQQYELQPGIYGRTGSDLLVTRYEYEYFED